MELATIIFAMLIKPIKTKIKKMLLKNQFASIALLSLAVLASGCNKDKDATTSQQLENVKAETKAAAQDMKDYTFAQKAEFTADMQAQLATINSDLDLLSAKIDKASDTVKAEAKPKLQALRDQADKLGKQLDAVKGSTESTWVDVKAGFTKAYNNLKDGFNESRQWVSDKIAP